MPPDTASNPTKLQPVRLVQKRAEITRVLAARPPASAEILLRWFCEKWLDDQTFSPTSQDVFQGCFARTETQPFDERSRTAVKNAFISARRWLGRFYLKPESYGEVQLDLPLPVRQGPYPGHYSIAFRHPASARASVPAVADITALMWHQMVHALPVRDLLLIYDTPKVGLKDEAKETDTLWAGSGEVAAACMLGIQLSRLQPSVKVAVRRWRDMTRAELEEPSRCLVILGSALEQPAMQRLCEREKWRQLQRFHFIGPKPGSSNKHICRRETGTGAREKQELFSYEVGTKRRQEADWALVSFFRDDDNLQTLIGLQGITTVGTLGAARFMCDTRSVRELRERLRQMQIGSLTKSLPSFELLMKVDVEADCFPGNTEISRLEPYLGEQASTSRAV